MQVGPIKPALKALEIKPLKLIYDLPLSKFAFNFNLRRYSKAVPADAPPLDQEGNDWWPPGGDEAGRAWSDGWEMKEAEGKWTKLTEEAGWVGGTEAGAYTRPHFSST